MFHYCAKIIGFSMEKFEAQKLITQLFGALKSHLLGIWTFVIWAVQFLKETVTQFNPAIVENNVSLARIGGHEIRILSGISNQLSVKCATSCDHVDLLPLQLFVFTYYGGNFEDWNSGQRFHICCFRRLLHECYLMRVSNHCGQIVTFQSYNRHLISHLDIVRQCIQSMSLRMDAHNIIYVRKKSSKGVRRKDARENIYSYESFITVNALIRHGRATRERINNYCSEVAFASRRATLKVKNFTASSFAKVSLDYSYIIQSR